jgi:nitroreductase
MVDLILKRRSIRKYTSEPVTDDQMRSLLEAAMAAPSARNDRPWHFVAVRDRETLDRLADAHPYAKMLKAATAAVAVCADPGISSDYWVQDCAAATENILIAAVALGLGTCWLGCHPKEDRKQKVREVLGIPGDVEVLSLIAVGHPDEQKEARTQYDPARDHPERW